MLLFALTVTALIGAIVFVVAIGLVVQKISYRIRTTRKAELDDQYLQKLSPLLLEEFSPDALDPDSLAFRQNCKRIFEPLRAELGSHGILSRRAHRAALKRVALEMSNELVGETRVRLTQAFQICGFVQDEMHDLKSRRWWIRAKACRNLALMRAEDATADFVILLSDEQEDVRTEAAMALMSISGVTALRPLLTNLHSISVWMSIQLSRVVLSMGSRAVPDLIYGLRAGQKSVTSFCAEMLGAIGDIAACEPLVDCARTGDLAVRSTSMIAIGKLGDARGKAVLLDGLSDEEEQSRVSAAQGLGYLASPETARQLKDHLLHDTIAVRLAAGKSLKRIEGVGGEMLVTAHREADTIGKRVILQFLEELGIQEDTLDGISV